VTRKEKLESAESPERGNVEYDIFRHRHNFSVWAAARATQRRFATVGKLRHALELSGIVEFVRDHACTPIDAKRFATLHADWCSKVMTDLKGSGVSNVTFGRAAKLVAVYLKAMVVVGPDSQCSFARVAHPPIDRMLLQNLARLDGLPRDAKLIFRTTNWTELSRHGYDSLIRLIQESVPDLDPFWRLEEYWTVTQDRDD